MWSHCFSPFCLFHIGVQCYVVYGLYIYSYSMLWAMLFSSQLSLKSFTFFTCSVFSTGAVRGELHQFLQRNIYAVFLWFCYRLFHLPWRGDEQIVPRQMYSFFFIIFTFIIVFLSLTSSRFIRLRSTHLIPIILLHNHIFVGRSSLFLLNCAVTYVIRYGGKYLIECSKRMLLYIFFFIRACLLVKSILPPTSLACFTSAST